MKITESILIFAALGFIFAITDGLALVATSTFQYEGVNAFEDPDNPLNIVYLFAAMLLFTALILVLSKLRLKQVLYGIFLGSTALIYFYVFEILFATVASDIQSLVLSLAVTAILTALLIKYPEWYVVDVCGVVLGVGSIATFGISLNVNLIVILLVGMAIYDAVSVYRTGHMVDLADAVFSMKIPVMLVIPKIRSYSLLHETRSLKEQPKEGEEREAFFIGLGDIVFPGILFVVAFLSVPSSNLLVALSVLAGTLIGLAVLMTFVVKGRPQAGLPCLGGGAILGYLVSSYLLFGRLVGLTL